MVRARRGCKHARYQVEIGPIAVIMTHTVHMVAPMADFRKDVKIDADRVGVSCFEMRVSGLKAWALAGGIISASARTLLTMALSRMEPVADGIGRPYRRPETHACTASGSQQITPVVGHISGAKNRKSPQSKEVENGPPLATR